MRLVLAAAALTAAVPIAAQRVDDRAAVAVAAPQILIVDKSLSPAAVAGMLRPVEAFYGFWNNASQALLDQAISSAFTDHALPPGRPQGPTGPMVAARGFLRAVPDLRVTIPQRLVVGDRVVTTLRMSGHFTGAFQGRKGGGQRVDFIATDVLRVRDGRITDNWHLEGNLTFMKQIGAVR